MANPYKYKEPKKVNQSLKKIESEIKRLKELLSRHSYSGQEKAYIDKQISLLERHRESIF